MDFLFLIIVLIFSAVIHEVAHGAVANSLGDSTAKLAGRLTLNPLKHLDPIGSVALPIFLVLMTRLTGSGIIFGWAKPVPINPFNFRDQKWGEAKVALAGPASNLAIAVIFGLVLRFLPNFLPGLYFLSGFYFILSYIVYINLLLGVFNLLPVPPLDGSHLLFTFFPRLAQNLKLFLNQFGFFIVLFIVFFLFPFLSSIIRWLFTLIVGAPLF